jgi:hypothetical protein
MLLVLVFCSLVPALAQNSTSSFISPRKIWNLDGSNGFEFETDFVGYSMSAGDVNGDGVTDIITGANEAWYTTSGEIYIIYGNKSKTSEGGSFQLSELDGSNGFVIYGESAGDRVGLSGIGCGDVNGDGYDDLLIGASYAGQSNQGQVYVLYGGVNVGVSGSYDLNDLSGTPTDGIVIAGEDYYDHFGESVAYAGDVNNDGYGDIIASAPYSGLYFEGRSYVIFGGPSLSSLNVSSLNGRNTHNNGFYVTCDVYQENCGDSAVLGISMEMVMMM